MTAPTDRELMMFSDGELDDARRDEVAAFLASSHDARRKLSGLHAVGELVQRDADRLATAFRADDIAARVMAKIEASEGSGPKSVAAVGRVPKGDARPANDNARYIYGLAAAAAAAAAALWLWGNGAPPPPVGSNEGPRAVITTPAMAEATTAPVPITSTVASATEPARKANETPGVEVASVNWGENQPGAVYYVPGNADGATTTVVWLAAQ